MTKGAKHNTLNISDATYLCVWRMDPGVVGDEHGIVACLADRNEHGGLETKHRIVPSKKGPEPWQFGSTGIKTQQFAWDILAVFFDEMIATQYHEDLAEAVLSHKRHEAWSLSAQFLREWLADRIRNRSREMASH